MTIAKVDATANDLPDEVQGFPTLKLFPAGAKSAPVEYSGDRSIEDLAKFVKENGKWKVDVYEGKASSDDADVSDDDLPKVAEAATAKAQEAASGAADAAKNAANAAAEAVNAAAGDDSAPHVHGHGEL